MTDKFRSKEFPHVYRFDADRVASLSPHRAWIRPGNSERECPHRAEIAELLAAPAEPVKSYTSDGLGVDVVVESETMRARVFGGYLSVILENSRKAFLVRGSGCRVVLKIMGDDWVALYAGVKYEH